MTYLIYYVEDVVGCYQTLDLVRFNLLVIIYRLFNEDKINRTAYNTMVTNLEKSYLYLDHWKDRVASIVSVSLYFFGGKHSNTFSAS